MTRQLESEQRNLGFTQDTAATLQQDFLKRSRRYQAEILAAQESLQQVRNHFSEESVFCPSDYEYAITSLNRMKAAVEGYCDLLDKSIYLPTTIISYVYPLIVILHYLDGQVCRLTATMRTFSPLCKPSSKHSMRKRKEISCRLASFMLNNEHSLWRMTVLLDQAHFPSTAIASNQRSSSEEDLVQ